MLFFFCNAYVLSICMKKVGMFKIRIVFLVWTNLFCTQKTAQTRFVFMTLLVYNVIEDGSLIN